MQGCFQNKLVLRSSHQDTFFNIALLQLWWLSLKNTCDGVQLLVNFHVTLSSFEPLLRKKPYFITALINAEQQRLQNTEKTPSVFRSPRSQMFLQIGVLKNFANLTGKHLCWSLFLIKLQRRCLVKSAKFLRTLFFTEHLFTVTASVCSGNLGKILVRNN